MQRLKEAIVDLYLAIKIRSTEEVSHHTHTHASLITYHRVYIARSDKRVALGAGEEEAVEEDRRIPGHRVHPLIHRDHHELEGRRLGERGPAEKLQGQKR